ncbi:MAG TPA: PAS domain-containing protein [Microcoleus sp.]|nr:PAS domain-containing protein [Microcoleus sp.]
MQNPRNTEPEPNIDPSVSTDSNKAFYPAAPLPTDVGMVLQLADGSIQGCNSHAQELLGMTAEQMLLCTSINSRWQTLREDGSDFPGETHPAMVALQTGQPCLNVIMGFDRPQGELIWLTLNSQPLFQGDRSTPYAVVTTFTPIAQQKPEPVCNAPAPQLSDTLESISDGFFALDRDWRFTYLNSQAARWLNRPSKDLIGNSIWEEFPESVGSLFEQEYRHAATFQVTVSFESFYPPLNAWYAVRAYPIPSGLAVYFQDVTEEKAARAAYIKQAQTAHQQLAEIEAIYASAPIGLCFLDTELRFVRINDWLAEINRVPAAAHIGKTLREILPEMADDLEPLYRKVIETKVPLQQLEVRRTNSAQPGVEQDWLLSLYPLKAEDDRVLGVNVTVHEITDRKATKKEIERLNQELERRVNELESILDAVPVGITIADDPQCKVIRANRFAQSMLIVPPDTNVSGTGEQAAALPFRRFRNGEEIPGEQLPMQLAVASGVEVRDVEIQMVRSDGVAFDWLVNAVPLFDEQGAVRGCVAAFMDISDRKRTEEELRQKNAILNVINESAPTPIFVKDREGRIIYANPATLEIMGKSASEVIGGRDIDLYPVTELAVTVTENDRRIMESGQTEVLEESHDGIRTFLVMKAPYRNQAGEVIGLIGISSEITNRKRAEVAREEQTKLLQVIIDSIGDGLILANQQGEFVLFNRAAVGIFGQLSNEKSCEEWSNTYGLFLADQKTLFPDAELPLARAIKGEYVNDVEVFVRREDAEGRWISISGYPVVDTSSEIKGGVIVCRDITERKQAEAAMQESEERFRNMANNAPFKVWVTDSTGYCTFLSETWYEFTGQTEETGLGLGWVNALHPEDREQAKNAFLTANERQKPYSVEYRVGRKDGGYSWTIDAAAPRFSEQGQFEGYIGSVIDITERKQVETERDMVLKLEQTARTEAERANRIKDEFLAVLSHELRSPLNPILGWSQLLVGGKLNASQSAKAFETIERNARLQSQLIEDLLDVSRILQGKLRLNVAPVNLATIIPSAVETVQLAAEAKKIQIQTILNPDVGQVLGDTSRLQQIVWNLLSNAVKFTPEGGRVEVRLGQIARQAQIQVTDTGKGIRPDFLPYVFDHFRQEDGATTRKFGGLGLGLAIVRQLIELHGGTVFAESAGEGQGATFTVRLPLLNDDSRRQEDEALNCSARPALSSLPLAGLRILVVDDELDSRDFVAFVLEEAGAEVISLSSAAEALQSIEQTAPDLLVSDIGMPHMDGYMFIERIRTQLAPEYRQLLAIALTAYAGEANERQVLQAGFDKHLAKPIDPTQLVATVARSIAAQRLENKA